MDKIKRVFTLMVQMQTREMHVHVIARELQVTERTAYRYLKLFREIGVKIDRTAYGAYTTKEIQPLKQPLKRRAKRNESKSGI